jgi:HAMP domain-containing protein
MMLKNTSLSWRTKLVLMMLLFSVGPVLIVSYLSFGILAETYTTSNLRGLQALAKAKAGAIDQFTDIRRRDVERISSLLSPHLGTLQSAERSQGLADKPPPQKMPQLKDAERAPQPGGPKPDEPIELSDAGASRAPLPAPAKTAARPEPKKSDDKQPSGPALVATGTPTTAKISVEDAFSALKQTLGLILWDQKEFEELLVIDPAGRVVAATFQGHEGKSAADLDYFKSGRKATYVQPVFMSPITDELTMMIAAPIRNEKLETIGVLAARLNLKRFFELINDTTGLGETGETVVAKKIGDNIVLMAPTRNDSDAALKRKIPVGSDQARALQDAARGQSGAGDQLDYRGVDTFAAWQYIPSLEWGLLSKMDRQEAMAPVNAARDRILVLTVFAVLLIIPASMAVARTLVQPLKDLKDATDRLSRGDFAVDLNIRSNDEIGELADSFERMVAAIKFFREQSRHEHEEDVDEVSEPVVASDH